MKLLVFIAKGFETIEFSAFVLVGRNATTYHLRGAYKQKVLEGFGATIVQTPIVVDENIITSYGPQTSYGVALLLLEKLTSHQEMVLVKEAMGF